MPWPRCPECDEKVDVDEKRDDTNPVEPNVYRSYVCTCGCWFHTVEKLISVRPETRTLQRKFPTRRADHLSGHRAPGRSCSNAQSDGMASGKT